MQLPGANASLGRGVIVSSVSHNAASKLAMTFPSRDWCPLRRASGLDVLTRSIAPCDSKLSTVAISAVSASECAFPLVDFLLKSSPVEQL